MVTQLEAINKRISQRKKELRKLELDLKKDKSNLIKVDKTILNLSRIIKESRKKVKRRK